MPRNLRWKIPLILLVVGVATFFTLPLQHRINLGLDLQGGMHLVLRVDTSTLPPDARADAAVRALEIIRNRVDQFGVREPVIQRQGTEHIVVQLPGVTDRERALELLGKTALLEFKLVSEDFNLVEEALGGRTPAGYALSDDEQGQPLLLEAQPVITGSSLTDARVDFGQYGEPVVNFTLNHEGGQAFARSTSANIGRRLAIVLDGQVQSAPVIRSRIANQGQITGQFNQQEAHDLAIVLRAGALPAPILLEEERTVGPTLGYDSIRSGVLATLIGGGLIVLFMVGYYFLAGLIAVLALALNLLLLLGGLGFFHATLTLPGIAGIVLTLGMAVDANVLIYERIREELRSGKPLTAAIHAGYQKAFHAIVDSNVTTLIAAALLFRFGTGPLKGFAVTLTIGLVASMFTAIVVTRVIFDLLIGKGWMRQLPMLQLFKESTFDFLGKRRLFYLASGILVVAGLLALWFRGERAYGIDFAGGQMQEYRFAQVVPMERLRETLRAADVGDVAIQQFGNPREILVRTVGDTVKTVEAAFQQVGVSFTRERVEFVGPVVGKQLRRQAILAILYALAGILLYVAVRFKQWDFGLAGVIALFHDVLVGVAFLAFTGRELSLTLVAALLTIAGFSINDTIVIYDRVRENTRLMRKMTLPELINLSINQMLSRTILTSLMVIMTVVALYFLGGQVLEDFAFCLLIGFISGVYSTVYIAGALVVSWRQRRARVHA